MASTPAASCPVPCFVLFPNTHCISGTGRCAGFFFPFFFFKLPLNSVSTKRDKAAVDTAADALNDGLDRIHPAFVWSLTLKSNKNCKAVRQDKNTPFFVSGQHSIRVWKHSGRSRGRATVNAAVSHAKLSGERKYTRKTGMKSRLCYASAVRIASGYCESAQALRVMRQFKAWWRPLSWHLQAPNASMMLTGSLDS